MKNKIKKSLIVLTSITALILGATNFASASYNPVSRDLCTLMVKPFDSTKNAITGSSGNQYINYLNNECEEHVTYPNVYSPQPPLKSDNPLKYNAEGKHLPLTRHDHIYYNDSLHDNYYYKSFVDRFEITLESDGYNSIDLDEIECQTPYPAGFNPSNLAPLLDCSGTVSNLWGGTTITKQYIGNNIRVTWDFGQTNQNGKYIGRPPVWGNNGPNFPEGNFADDDDRSLEFYITLPSEDNDEIWSATTTSKVLVADLSIKKSNFNTNSTLGCSENNVNSPNSGWCYLTPNPGFQTETVFTSSNKTFYWLPIGSVTTVWREPELNICTNLSASMLNETCTAGGETGHRLQYNSVDFSDGTPANLELNWTSTDPQGEFWLYNTNNKLGTGSATTNLNQHNLCYVGEGSVTVVADLPAEQLTDNCERNFDIPEIESVCTGIDAELLDGQVKINNKNAHRLRFNSISFSEDIPAGLLIKWTSDDPNGEFYVASQNGGYIKIGTGSATTNQAETEVFFLGSETVVHVQPDLPANKVPNVCKMSIDIPKSEPICAEIFVDHNETIYTDTYSRFNTAAKDTEGKAFPSKIKYSTSIGDDYGYFSFVKPDNVLKNPTNMVYEIDLIFNNFNILDDISVPLFEPAADFILDYAPQMNPLFSYMPKHYGLSSILALNVNPGVQDPFDGQGGLVDTPGLVDSPLGGPLDDSALADVLFPKSITANQNQVIYFVGKTPGENVIHVRPEDTEEQACIRRFSIEELPRECETLNFTSAPLDPLEIGQSADLDVDPVDQFGDQLPQDTQFKITNTAGGTLTSNVDVELGTTAILSQFPITFEGSTKSGEVTVEIYPKDPYFSDSCKNSIEVGEGLVCEELTYTLKKFPITPVTELEEETLYTISANVTYNLDNDNTVTYKIDNQYGIFVEDIPGVTLNEYVNFLRFFNNVSIETLDAVGIAPTKLKNQITVDENTEVSLVTFSNLPEGFNADVLEINATGFYNDECTEDVPINVEAGQCQNLSIQPVQGKFDPQKNQYSVFNISGDFKNHKGEIVVELSNDSVGTIFKIPPDPLDTPRKLTFSNNKVKNSNNNLVFSYQRPATFDENSKVSIAVRATNPSTPACQDTITKYGEGEEEVTECTYFEITNPDRPWIVDKGEDQDDREQLFQIKVKTKPSGLSDELYYTWEVTDGDGYWNSNDEDDEITEKGDLSQELLEFDEDTKVEVWASLEESGSTLDNCEDYIKAKAEDEEDHLPKITKYVYPKNHLNDLDDLININDQISHVTYLIRFGAGNLVKSTEIKENSFTNGKIVGSPLGGSLNFEGMRINVNHDGDEYTILQTPGYKEDSYTGSSYSDKHFDEKGNGTIVDEYEDDYRCSDDNNDLCIVGDFDTAISNFKKGQPIRFKNLKEDTLIFIKYRMSNNSEIDEEKCEELKTVCGEEFNNKASYKAYENADFSGEDYEDYDKAKVIVICPFILTREGGDVFFHDVIDTGVDVAQCSKVKGHTGPGVTPTPIPEVTTPSTGAGDIPEEFKDLSLTLPSHDVCKYSNLDTNLEGYNDVLKNFSSTICELRANVAKDWTEEHINKSIEANITRLTRFESNNISTWGEQYTLLNAKSGVFLSSNLKIENEVTIEAPQPGISDVPAARTYIVQGGNLEINANIKYGETDYNNPSKIPSVAFIVIDGDIIIDASVTHIDGILMAVNTDPTQDKGQIRHKQVNSTTNQLTINGNLIGNVYDLFSKRRGSGDPTKDQGAVVIHYDERILLNTPPGISELIDLQQVIVPN